jgi:hypothetical protein
MRSTVDGWLMTFVSNPWLALYSYVPLSLERLFQGRRLRRWSEWMPRCLAGSEDPRRIAIMGIKVSERWFNKLTFPVNRLHALMLQQAPLREAAIEDHQRSFGALIARDALGAQEQMRKHIERVIREFAKAW